MTNVDGVHTQPKIGGRLLKYLPPTGFGAFLSLSSSHHSLTCSLLSISALSWLAATLLGLLSTMTAMAASLFPRGPQTNATCLHEFSWMDNESGLSACLVAAYVMSSCGSGSESSSPCPAPNVNVASNSTDFAVLSLVDGAHYDEPGKGENVVTSCSWCVWTCFAVLEGSICASSWAGYNMLAACTACQGFEDSIFGCVPMYITVRVVY